jgi:spermidine/putrescine transport system ATP-binding protein
MDRGEVLQIGSPTEIYERPNCRFVADFIGETNFLNGSVIDRDNGHVTVQIAPELIVQVPEGDSDPTATQVTIAIRPEKLRLKHTPLPESENCLPGTIHEVVYIGTDTHFLVSLTDTLTIRVRQQNIVSTPDRKAYYGERGDPVYVSWAPESTLLLTE